MDGQNSSMATYKDYRLRYSKSSIQICYRLLNYFGLFVYCCKNEEISRVEYSNETEIFTYFLLTRMSLYESDTFDIHIYLYELAKRTFFSRIIYIFRT
jgi:hypothetical protein